MKALILLAAPFFFTMGFGPGMHTISSPLTDTSYVSQQVTHMSFTATDDIQGFVLYVEDTMQTADAVEGISLSGTNPNDEGFIVYGDDAFTWEWDESMSSGDTFTGALGVLVTERVCNVDQHLRLKYTLEVIDSNGDVHVQSGIDQPIVLENIFCPTIEEFRSSAVK